MPSLNRKGPEGKGPMTGRQMGLCSGNAERGNDIAFRGGRGFRRFGNRRGMQGGGVNRNNNQGNERSYEELKELFQHLDKLQKRIETLEERNIKS
jgi:hypothetical protein